MFLFPKSVFDNGENIALFDDGKFLAVHLEIRARVLGAKHLVADLHLHLDLFSVDDPAGADGHDDTGLGFFLGGRGKKKSAFRLFFDVYAFHDNFVE